MTPASKSNADIDPSSNEDISEVLLSKIESEADGSNKNQASNIVVKTP